MDPTIVYVNVIRGLIFADYPGDVVNQLLNITFIGVRLTHISVSELVNERFLRGNGLVGDVT